jgi:hypothetical protein
MSRVAFIWWLLHDNLMRFAQIATLKTIYRSNLHRKRHISDASRGWGSGSCLWKQPMSIRQIDLTARRLSRPVCPSHECLTAKDDESTSLGRSEHSWIHYYETSFVLTPFGVLKLPHWIMILWVIYCVKKEARCTL